MNPLKILNTVRRSPLSLRLVRENKLSPLRRSLYEKKEEEEEEEKK